MRFEIEEMSPRQRKVFNFLKDYISQNGYPPSVREICDATGAKSTSTVHAQLRRLEAAGLIRRDPAKPRALEILDDDSQARLSSMTVPVIGKVAAGMPIMAYENIEEYISLPEWFVRDENSFVLRVQGESMINAGIYDGDHVIVRKQSYADDGEIVVALIEDEATVKRFYSEGNMVRLQPENPAMDPIMVKKSEVSIIGRVTGLFRRIR